MTGRSLAAYIEAHGIIMEVTEGPEYLIEEYTGPDGLKRTMPQHHYTVTFWNEDEGTEMTAPYFQHANAMRDPEDHPDEILDILISDAWGYENAGSFEAWMDEYGYENWYEASKTWKKVEKAANDLIDFLGGKPELEKLALKFERL